MPYGQVWRLGADEATTLTTDKDSRSAGRRSRPGTYTLFLMPEEEGAKLIVNKQTGQWGTKYDEKQDLVRIELKKQPATSRWINSRLRWRRASLKLIWEDVQYSAAIPCGERGESEE